MGRRGPPQHRPSPRPHHCAGPSAIRGAAQTSTGPDSQGAQRGRPKLADTATRPANHRGHRASEADRAYRQPRYAFGPQAGQAERSHTAADPAYKEAGAAASAAEVTRLRHLKELGLSKPYAGDRWLVRSDFVTQLQQMKDIQDRARTLFRSGVAISDPHAPMEYSTFSKKLIGRVLLNSEDERTGALQTIFETTEGKIEIIRHDATLRAAWARGDLEPGNVVTIDSLRSDPDKLYASTAGKDKDILRDGKALGFDCAPDARHESRQSANPTKDGWANSTEHSAPG